MAGCPICEDLHHGASSCPFSLAGQSLGNYRVDRFLAAGGMGAVYVGEHQTLGSPVAIKTLHRAFLPQHARGDERRRLAETLVKRFTDEARRAASLRHPNIVRVEDLGVAPDGTPYLAMEFLEGMSLKELLESSGPLDPARAAELVAQALDALEFAHQRNIIHRDIKPENLYLQHPGTRGELVKVLDFGIAKAVGDGATRLGLTQTGHGAMGTFYYMSPEQAADPRKVTASSDVFSVGASLFELLTGKNVLFEIERELTTSGLMAVQFLHGVLSAIMEGSIERHPRKVRGEIPEWLDAIVARSLAHDPAGRFASAGEMAEALHAGAAGQPVGATPAALAATAPSQPIMVPRTQVAPPVPDAERPSARMAAARASGAALGSTTSESAGQRVAPLEPVKSSRAPLLVGVGVAVLAAAGVAIAALAGGGDSGPTAAPDSDAQTVAPLSDAAPAPGFDEVIRQAKTGDCAAAAEVYRGITNSDDAGGRAGALVALGNCELAAGRIAEATVLAERAVKLAPDNPEVGSLAAATAAAGAEPETKDTEPIAESEKSAAGLQIVAEPPCEAYVDGRRVGRTPVGWFEIAPGRHKVTLINTDHNIRETFTVKVKPGEKKKVVKDLSDQVKPGIGFVAIASRPPCRIFVDGRDTGKGTPQRRLEMRAGKHMIHLINNEHGIKERFPIEVRAGETVKLIKNFSDQLKTGTTGPEPRCDEVSCLVAKDPPACCDKFKKKDTPPGPKPDDSLPPAPTRSDISSGMARVRGRVQACGDRHPFNGTVKVRLKVAPEGSIASASASNGPEALQRCIEQAVRRARFPKTQRGITFSYPFAFR